MIRPTLRAVLIFAVGIPLALLIVIFDPALWPLSFNFGILVLIVVASDAGLAFPQRLLNAKVATPDRLYIGERGATTITIPAAGFRRAARFEAIAEQRGDMEPAKVVAGELAPGAEARIALPIMPHRRGRITIDGIWLRWRGPLSLVEFTRRIAVDRTVDVLPNVRGVHGSALQFFIQEAIYGIKTQVQKGEGTEFEALREYTPGLDSRFIDWKHSARHNKLVCKEFRTERNHQVVMAFDTGYLMLEPVDGLARLDHAINAGLQLAWVSLQGGDLVGTYGFDARVRQYMTPARGVASFQRLQRATAELDYHHQETNFTLGLAELNARLKRRALVILFTDFVDTITAELLIESMQRVANRHLVVFVTQRGSVLQNAVDAAPHQFGDVAQAVIAQDFLRERSIVFERLERLGIQCLDVPSAGLPVALINRYLMIKQRGLI
ncbi:MAG TPA: DUF58 domain-containing protein [Xanthobacteraceae bacterium]|jgi:uncharacterized protein (DUF58 family)|nr:DUF58 domain-containing protein [Xanthobacteraceae bacterium]